MGIPSPAGVIIMKVGDLVQLSEESHQNLLEDPDAENVINFLDLGVGLVTECTSDGSDGQLLLVYWHRGKREWLMLDEVERING